jgi:hypothetical protein
LKELNLNCNFKYFRKGRILDDEEYLPKGNSWINYRCVLKGGRSDVRFPNIQVEFFVIYTSMEKLISLEKVDLIGLDNKMDEWLMKAIDYDTSCKVSILEVESKGEYF